MDSLGELRRALYEARMQSGDAILALEWTKREIETSRRVMGKLIAVCPELVEAAILEVQEEDDRA